MKHLFLIAFFTINAYVAKSQCIRIYVAEKIRGIEIPVERRDFEVTVNDTLKRNKTSTNDGFLVRLSLEKGKYNVKLTSPDFKEVVMPDVVVEESKSTDITIIVAAPGAILEKEKKKR